MYELSLRSAFSRASLRAASSGLALGLAFVTGSILAPMAAHAGSSPVVQTTTGKVEGFTTSGITEFLGIPYAAPPVGNLRWMPPQAHAAWGNVLKATAFGANCAEVETLGVFAGPANHHEDCLYINVFTPNVGTGAGGKLPVMFWSYGGGEVDGESNDYDGSKLALQGNTVVVTFNYRMNLLGFLAHPALDAEGHLFANYGLLDNQFALRWVKQNIANFGGDPGNVTILGQSAGARNTSSELLSPLAAGLFNRAIFESGALPTLTPLSIAEAKGTAFAVAAGCGSGATPAVAACLRALPAAKVERLAGTQSSASPYVAGLIADGTIEPTVAITAYETGQFNHVPVLDGDVENEGNFALAQTEYFESPRKPLTEGQFVTYVASAYSGNAGPGGSPPAYPRDTVSRVLEQYPPDAYPNPQQQWAALETDANYTCPTRHVNQILASQVPLYSYEFRDQSAPSYFPKMPGFVPLAYHTSDIQYYWPLYHGGNQGIPHPLNSNQQHLSDQLVTAWSNFAWSGNPNKPVKIPGPYANDWPLYTGNNPLILAEDIFPPGLSTETDDFWSAEHHCKFWDSVLVYKPAQ
jgi:para-nitrobenzyl esterase